MTGESAAKAAHNVDAAQRRLEKLMDNDTWAAASLTTLLRKLARQAAAELREEGMRALESSARLRRFIR